MVALLAAQAVAAMPLVPTAPAAPTPIPTGAPSLTGSPTLGQTLSCSSGSWGNKPDVFSYAWLRDGVAIVGQSANTYVTQAADAGHAIACQVTAKNSGGEYLVKGLPSGSYKVEFFPEGLNYLPQFYNGQPTTTTATPVAVTAPNVTQGINAALQVAGQITGRVTAPGGAPLANASVCAYKAELFGGCATTNAAGEYAVVGLPTGSYTVEFSSGEFFFGTGAGNYLTQFYSGKAHSGEADQVPVTAGATASGINAELQAGGQVSGTVTDAKTHQPVANIVVCAVTKELEEFGGCALSGANGQYTIGSLPAGKYVVAFFNGFFGEGTGNYLTQYYNGKPTEGEAELVSVTPGSTSSGIDAELQPGGQIAGTVTDASTNLPLANVQVCARFVFSCASTDGSGKYTISSLESGSYTVEFNATEGNYLSQSTSGVSVTTPSTTSPVDAKLQAGGQISGTVMDAANNQPLSSARVCASGKCASTNAAGQYLISGLASGVYKVEFSSFEGGYLSQSLEGVGVTAGAVKQNVNAALALGGQIEGKVTGAPAGLGLENAGVCAFEIGGAEVGRCTSTNGPGATASAISNSVVVLAPTSAFKMVRKPVFDKKTGTLDFFFQVTNPGTFSWSLSFRNADVGFADSLGVSLGEGFATAQAAKKKCKRGYLRRKGRCVRKLVPFSHGSASVPAGTVEVKARASAQAIKALKAGRTLHVSGPFVFRSSLGGAPVSHTESATVKLPKKHKKHRRK